MLQATPQAEPKSILPVTRQFSAQPCAPGDRPSCATANVRKGQDQQKSGRAGLKSIARKILPLILILSCISKLRNYVTAIVYLKMHL